LNAGLLVLDNMNNPDASTYGYYAIAFIAGYNVDNFMKKLESVSQSVWGISKSNVGKTPEQENGGGI
jgi:hypothetical protein